MKIGCNYQIPNLKTNSSNKVAYKPNFNGEVNINLPKAYQGYVPFLTKYVKNMFPIDDISLTGEAVDGLGSKIMAKFDILMRNGKHSITEGPVCGLADIMELTHQSHSDLHTNLGKNKK